jgi:hypothetical protein
MRQALFAFALLVTAALVITGRAAADDFKIIKLEQDVRNLERQVQTLTREINELRGQLDRSADRLPAPGAAPAPAVSSPSWLDASNWNRVRPGMDELSVIGALGPPTSMREENGARVLLYAMEIGSSGFLGGSVALRDRKVVEIQKPALK